jgi:hypothetical protein
LHKDCHHFNLNESLILTPDQRAKTYEDLALDFWRENSEQQIVVHRPDGTLFKYDIVTKEFSAIQPDGSLMTYFVVQPGESYSFRSHSEYVGLNLRRKHKNCDQTLSQKTDEEQK